MGRKNRQSQWTLLYWICFLGLILLLLPLPSYSQTVDRIQTIQEKLEQLSVTVPGLHNKVQLAVNGVSIQDFISALSRANDLSINIDPKLSVRIVNNFTGVNPVNILCFLAKNYNLDVTTIGSIINIAAYIDPNLNVKPVKEIKVKFNAADQTLSLDLDNDSLYAVSKKITLLTGKNIVVTPSLMNSKVSGYFADAPFENALEKLAFANTLKMVRTKDNFYLFQPLDENEEVYVNGDKNTAVRRAFKAITPSVGGNLGLFSRVVNGEKLISIDAANASIQDLVKSASQELNKNYFLYSDLKGTITSHINDISFDHFLGSLFAGTDYTFRVENGIYLIGDRKLEGLRSSRVIMLQNRSLDTVQAMIPLEWRRGVEIKEFREQNTLLLSGSGPQINELEAYIRQLDQLVPMIMIEVTLIDINNTNTISTGIKFGTADSVKTGGALLPGINYTIGSQGINNLLNRIGGSTLNLGQVAPSFYANISAIESKGNVEVHSVPKLTTLNGHTASLSIGSSEYYLVQTQNVIPSLSAPSSIFTQQYNKVDANLVINIRPIVSGNDQVTLNIKVDITDFIGTPPTNAPPPTSTSKFESIIRAHNGDMIVLGGLERIEKDESSSGVPILSKIPILKWIFSSRSRTKAKKVTLVFIKPTIIR